MIAKRTKNGAVHYAKVLTPIGRIDYLTPNRGEACDLTPDQVEKVKAQYKDRPEFGTLTFEPRVPETKPAEKPAPKG